MSEQIPKRYYEFGPFRLDAAEGQLWRDGEEIQLTQKSFKVLTLLVENGGHVLDKNALMEKVWPDAFVEENRLADNVSTLRKALGDDPRAPSYIKTVPGRGYRFVAAVREVQDGAVAVIEQTRTHLVIEEEYENPLIADSTSPVVRQENIVVPQLPPRPSRRRLDFVLIAIGGVACTALVVAAYVMLKDKTTTPSGQVPLARSIAVLPFKPLVSSQSDPALEWGLTDALIARLTNIRQIAVRPTSSVMKYTSEGQDLSAAGSELSVDVLLDGKVQKAGDRIRLSVQLVRASDGTPLWAEKFDEKFTDIFAVQDAISRRVADALALKLGGEEKARLAKRDTTSSDAYQLYLNGLYFFNKFTPADHQKAAEYFQQAISKDPGYALAHAGLADTFGASATNGWLPPKEGYPKAMAAAKKAVELDGTLAEAHSSLGGLNMFYELNWTTAEQEFNRAAELDARCLSAYKLFSYLLVATGRLDEGVMKAKRGLELDPVSADLSEDVAAALYYSRRYDESIAQWQKSLELEPHRANSHFALGMTYEQKGMYREAFAEYQKAISLSERTSQFLGQLGHAYAVSGKRTEALKILHELEDMSRHSHVAPYDLAILYTGLGERDKAIEQLNKAYEERSGFIIYLAVEPQFDALRSDPRYAALLLRMNLATKA